MQEPSKQKTGIFDFIRVAFTDFAHTGTLFPSSSAASKNIAGKIPIKDNTVIVEYGSGNGLLTQVLLQSLKPSGKLFGIEINSEFIGHLKQLKDSRLTVIDGDVVKISSNLKSMSPTGVDAVVSGIPFSFLKPEMRDEIVKNTFQQLNPGGVFVVYQNSPALLPVLKRHFEDVSWSLEVRNLPPYFIMVGRKF